MHLGRRPAHVEGAAHRPRAEPVDGRSAAGLDVGQQLQPPGQLGLERAGCDRGQVGLDQHVVDRLRQQVARAGVPGRRRPAAHAVRRQPAEPGHPERRGLGQRPGHLVGPAARPARTLPSQPGPPPTACRSPRPAPRPGPATRARRGSSTGPRSWSGWPARATARSRACRLRRAPRPGRASAGSPARRAPASPSARRRRSPPRRRTRRSAPRPGCRRCRPGLRAGRRPRPPRPAARWSSRRRGGGSLRPSARARRGHRCAVPRPAACPSGRAAARSGVPPRRRHRPRPGRRSRRHGQLLRSRVPARAARGWSVRRAAPARPRPAGSTVPPGRGTRSLRASSSSAGVSASAGSTVCRAAPVVASPPSASTCSSMARAAGDSASRWAVTSSGVGGSELRGRSPLRSPASTSASPVSGRIPTG